MQPGSISNSDVELLNFEKIIKVYSIQVSIATD